MGKKITVTVSIIIGLTIVFFAVVGGINTTKRGPTEWYEFGFDVPMRDNHIIAVEAVVTYHVRDIKVVVLDPEEAEDRVYSNVSMAFRLATTGVPFEKFQEDLGKDKLESEVLRIIASNNRSLYDTVTIDDVEFSLTFDPPVEGFGQLLPFKEGSLTEIDPQPPLGLSPRRGATIPF